MEIFSAGFFSALLAIVVIDLVLAGDNAIVIALAARNLPPPLRRRAIAWGTLGAIAVRTAMTLVVVSLLKIPGLLLAGGALLIWIAYKLLVEESGDGGESDGAHGVAPAASFFGAMRTIVVADALMGLDNVLAVAGAAHGSFLLVVLGLLISIPLVIWGSQLVLKVVERYPMIVYVGSGVLAWTAVKMMTHEPMVQERLDAYPLVIAVAYVLVIGGVLAAGFLRKHAPARARVAAHIVIAKSESPDPTHETRAPQGPTTRKVLVAVDGTPNAESTLRHVLSRYGRDPGLEVHMLYARTPLLQRAVQWLRGESAATSGRDSAERTFAPLRQVLDQAGVPYATHVAEGDSAQSIDRAARRLQAQHIFVGAAPSRSVTRVLQDIATSRLLQSAHVPVEVVPGDAVSPAERWGFALGAGALMAALALMMAE